MLISAGDLFFAYIYTNISLKSLSGHAIKWLFVSGQMLVLREEVNPQNREGKPLSYCKLCWKRFSFSCIFIDFKRRRGKHQYKPIQRPINSVFNSRSVLSTVSRYTRAGFFSPVLQQHKQGWMLLWDADPAFCSALSSWIYPVIQMTWEGHEYPCECLHCASFVFYRRQLHFRAETVSLHITQVSFP